MDRLWVKDVQIGQRAAGVFLVVRKLPSSGKGGKTFLKLQLQDKTGSLDARVWNDVEAVATTFEVNDLIEVEGAVDAFQGHPQLSVEKLAKPSAETVGTLDPKDFLLVAPEPTVKVGPAPAGAHADAALSGLRSELARLSDPFVRTLVLSFVDDPDVASLLKRAPAAKEIHHAYPGGLVEHLSSCVRLAHRMADHYPMADRDLLVAGSFLHDLGKISELSFDHGTTQYTDEGRLVGHLVMTAGWIHDRAAVIEGFPWELELHLTHLVLSHHGRLEYGSPKLPMTLEAFLVHEIDEIDSRVNSMLTQMSKGNPGDRWTDPQKSYERLLFKGPLPTETGRRRGPAWRAYRRGGTEKKKRREVPSAPVEARPEGAAVEEPRPPRESRPREERRPREPRPPRAEKPREPRPPREARPERPAGEHPPAADRPPRPARPGEKLTFKPFSALVEGAEGEADATPPPAADAASSAPETEPSAPETPTSTPEGSGETAG